MKNVRKAFGILMLTMMLAICAVMVTGVKTQAAEPATTKVKLNVKYGQTEARKMTALVNELRTGKDNWFYDQNNKKIKNGALPKLKYDYNLEALAMKRAAEIAINFSHERPNGTNYYTIYDDKSASLVSIGENIAVGQKTYDKAFAAWAAKDKKFDGQRFRRNMLSASYGGIGIGHAYVNGYHFWVQLFSDVPSKAMKTMACNTSKLMTVEVLNSKIKKGTIAASPKVITSSVAKTKQAPVVVAKVEYVNTWKKVPVKVQIPVTWTSHNPFTVKVVQNKTLQPVACGATSVRTVALKQNVKVPVKIIPQQTLMNPAVPAKKSVKASWTPVVTEATGYEVQYSTDAKFKKAKTVKVKPKTEKEVTIKKLSPKTVYYLRMRTYVTKLIGGEKKEKATFVSGWTKTMKTKTEK